MNLENGNIRNYLFLSKDAQYTEQFQKFCFECTKSGRTVLFITKHSTEFLPFLSQLQNEGAKDNLKRFIIMYFECIEDVTKKLADLHDWSLLPALVVIDLFAFIVEYDVKLNNNGEDLHFSAPVQALQALCLCVVNLFNYMNTLGDKLRKTWEIQTDSVALAHSIVLLNTYSDVLTQAQLELIINLYFYNSSAFDDFDEITSKVSLTWN